MGDKNTGNHHIQDSQEVSPFPTSNHKAKPFEFVDIDLMFNAMPLPKTFSHNELVHDLGTPFSPAKTFTFCLCVYHNEISLIWKLSVSTQLYCTALLTA